MSTVIVLVGDHHTGKSAWASRKKDEVGESSVRIIGTQDVSNLSVHRINKLVLKHLKELQQSGPGTIILDLANEYRTAREALTSVIQKYDPAVLRQCIVFDHHLWRFTAQSANPGDQYRNWLLISKLAGRSRDDSLVEGLTMYSLQHFDPVSINEGFHHVEVTVPCGQHPGRRRALFIPLELLLRFHPTDDGSENVDTSFTLDPHLVQLMFKWCTNPRRIVVLVVGGEGVGTPSDVGDLPTPSQVHQVLSTIKPHLPFAIVSFLLCFASGVSSPIDTPPNLPPTNGFVPLDEHSIAYLHHRFEINLARSYLLRADGNVAQPSASSEDSAWLSGVTMLPWGNHLRTAADTLDASIFGSNRTSVDGVMMSEDLLKLSEAYATHLPDFVDRNAPSDTSMPDPLAGTVTVHPFGNRLIAVTQVLAAASALTPHDEAPSSPNDVPQFLEVPRQTTLPPMGEHIPLLTATHLLDLASVVRVVPANSVGVAEKYIEHGLIDEASFQYVRYTDTKTEIPSPKTESPNENDLKALSDPQEHTGETIGVHLRCWSSNKTSMHTVQGYLWSGSIGFFRCTCGTAVTAACGNLCRHVAAALILCTHVAVEKTRDHVVFLDPTTEVPKEVDAMRSEKDEVDRKKINKGEDFTPLPPASRYRPATPSYNPQPTMMSSDGLPLHMVAPTTARLTGRKRIQRSGESEQGNTPALIREAIGRGPNAPKRPLTPFFYYSSTTRGEMHKNSKPGTSAAQLAVELGRLWREMDPETKNHYVAESKADRMRFQAEWEVYIQTDEYKQLVALPLAAVAAVGTARSAPSPRKAKAAGSKPEADPLPAVPASVAIVEAFEEVNTEWKRNDEGQWVCEWDSETEETEHLLPAKVGTAKKKRRVEAPKPKLGSVAVFANHEAFDDDIDAVGGGLGRKSSDATRDGTKTHDVLSQVKTQTQGGSSRTRSHLWQ